MQSGARPDRITRPARLQSAGRGQLSQRVAKIFWDRLYAAGAEIVIDGHAHDYEREARQAPDLLRDDARGIRAFVVGTGGAGIVKPTTRPNTEVVSTSGNTHGVLKLTSGRGTYTWDLLLATGPAFTESGTGTCH